jgi:hypothetical protein
MNTRAYGIPPEKQRMKGEAGKYFVDATSMGVVVATLANWLPSIAALFTIIWTVIRIWETDTLKKMTGRKR